MGTLLELKERLISFYEGHRGLIDRVLRFTLSLVLIGGLFANLVYLPQINVPFMAILLSGVCAFLPSFVLTALTAVLAVLLVYSYSKLLAFSVFLLLLILYLLYFRFCKEAYLVTLIVMAAAFLHVPLFIPILGAVLLTGLPLLSVPVGLFLYYVFAIIGIIEKAQTVQASMEASSLIPYVYSMITGNREMLVVLLTCTAALLVVSVIKSLAISHSFSYAIVAGAIVEAVSFLLLNMSLDGGYDVTIGLLQIAAGIVAGELAVLFRYNIDNTKAERLRIEDSEYYYYVTAIPKRRQAKRDIKITHINARKIRTGQTKSGTEDNGQN